MVPLLQGPLSMHYCILGMLSGRPQSNDSKYGDAVDMLWPTEKARMGAIFVQALTALHQHLGCHALLVERDWAWCSADLAAHVASWYGDHALLDYTMFPDGWQFDPVVVGPRRSFIKGILLRRGFWDETQQHWEVPFKKLAESFVLYQILIDLRWYGVKMVHEALEGTLVFIIIPMTPWAQQLVDEPWPWEHDPDPLV
ncbi:hypothetical protein [Herpetosiphon llansteffanensis]|uniref:hypothetical protein n=1 Tax=Herpetosiphon llansteffanensis TaxID=2094568 RepID=UPI000D7BD1C0|nr:hypothetical protein [Herpetosiphon llansteffanensis]